jgi:DNA-binding NtrC family response regulator
MLDVGITYAEAVRQFRSAFVRVALVENNGNRVKTARALGVHRNTLRQTLSSLGIAVERRPPQKVEIALARKRQQRSSD